MDLKLNKIQIEIKKLTEKILHYNNLYYNENISEISDFEYDMLLKKLENLERLYPQYKIQNSPTTLVGTSPQKKIANQVVHKIKMESLQNAYNFSDLFDFHKRVLDKIKNASYVVEPKVDGLSVSLEYVNGVFVRGSTRGNGFVGEDVTENLKMLNSVPKKLSKEIEFLEVRAEVYMSPKNFRLFNLKNQIKSLKKAWSNLLELEQNFSKKTLISFLSLIKKQPLQNPRNAAAGILKQKNSNAVKQSGLNAVVFNLQQISENSFANHSQTIEFLKYLGFNTIDESEIFFNIENCIIKIKEINKTRSHFDFEIDGAVIKLNSLSGRTTLGSTAKFPRWAIAYKYEPEQKKTILKEIKINVGRTGILTPIAVFEPIVLAQTKVRKASLHNQNFISNLDIRVGDEILVRKAGEIIPEVVKSVKHDLNSKPFLMPTHCPVCGSKVFKNENEVAVRCVNSNCPSTLVLNIFHFASKPAMNIKGLGMSIIKELVQKRLIQNVADLFRLKLNEIMNLERFNIKSAKNLFESIQLSKKNELWRLICGLGIRGVGENVAKLLCKNYSSMTELSKTNLENLSKLEGVGEIIGSNIVEFFSLTETQKLIFDFEKLGVNLVNQQKEKSGKKLNGLVFSITGKLDRITRNEFKSLVENNSGEYSNTITKKVTHLVSGTNESSKLEKARKLKIKILNEEQFFDIISKN